MIRFAHVPMPEAFFGLSRPARLVWFALCSFATWRDGRPSDCFPSLKALAKAAGAGQTLIREGIKELERAGFIKKRLRLEGKLVVRTDYELCVSDGEGGCAGEQRGVHRHAKEGPLNGEGGSIAIRQEPIPLTNINNQYQGPEDRDDPAAAAAALHQVIQLWNDLLTPLGFPEVLRATSARRRAFGARLAEAPERRDLAWWEALIGRVGSTPFLAQSAAEGAKWLTLDWLLKEQNLTKLSEGRYDGANRRAVPKSGLEEYLRELAKDPFFGGDDA